MYAYLLKDNHYILITKDKKEPSQLLELLMEYGYFEPVYVELEEVLVDLVSSMLLDLNESNNTPQDITNQQLQTYIFNKYFEDYYDITTQSTALLSHICQNLSQYTTRKYNCKKLSLNTKQLQEGLFDIRDLIVWRK